MDDLPQHVTRAPYHSLSFHADRSPLLVSVDDEFTAAQIENHSITT